jgi:dihydrofolate reductase
MGRATYDAIISMDFPWPHAERHTVVATTRPLVDAPPGVSPAAGTIDELIAISKDHAGAKDIYLDGGDLIRQSLESISNAFLLGIGLTGLAAKGRRRNRS